jgi:ubiquinone/menaquinone biosynthesis C-methylase UbiE
MTQTNLNLPLEYKKQPQYFDAFNISDDTDSKNSVIEKILKKHKVKSVLDLTCGTGSQVLFLAKSGYEITGADFSSELLKQARIKAKKERLNLKFLDGDMRNLKVGKFDAVITIFNAVGHLTKSGFEKAMCNINQNLKDGGIYVFDIFNLEAMDKENVAKLACFTHKKIGDTQIHAVQFSTLDKEAGILTSYNNYMTQKNAEKPKSFNHKFSLQIYTATQLKEMLSRSGFRVLEQYEIDGSDFLKKKSTSILMVAQKAAAL